MSQEFEKYRSLLFGIAYRMIGSVMEAEDIVQDCFLRYQSIDTTTIQSTEAFLRTIVTRLCLDHLKSAKVQREQYIGEWLPEPITTKSTEDQSIQYESISMAFLVMLEQLTPVERAVFLLREVFSYEYAEIASIVEKSESTCRKILSRAKSHMQSNRPRFNTSKQDHMQMFEQFMIAIQSGEISAFEHLLAENISLVSDGGGKRTAATRPLFGMPAVAKFILGITRLQPDNFRVEFHEVNGQLSLIGFDRDEIEFVMLLDIAEEEIHTIRIMRNPDKLTSLNLT